MGLYERYRVFRRSPGYQIPTAALSIVLVWLGVVFWGFEWWVAVLYTIAVPWIVLRVIRGR